MYRVFFLELQNFLEGYLSKLTHVLIFMFNVMFIEGYVQCYTILLKITTQRPIQLLKIMEIYFRISDSLLQRHQR